MKKHVTSDCKDKPDKILNPLKRRYVLRTGAIGKKLLTDC